MPGRDAVALLAIQVYLPFTSGKMSPDGCA